MNARVKRLAVVAAGVMLGLAGAVAPSAWAWQDTKAVEAEGADLLIFRNGNVLKGTIVSETERSIKFKGSAGGIAFETEYDKSEILEIKRGSKATPAPAPGTTPAKDTPSKASATPTPAGQPTKDASKDDSLGSADAVKVYWIPLTGIFGEDVSQKPLLDAIKDAKAQEAKVIIMTLDAKSIISPRTGESIDDKLAWDMTSRVEQIFPVFTEEVPKLWPDRAQQPRFVMVVKRAMGGAAFFPLGFKEVYFETDGRMGGVGTLSELFSGRGDDVVREKQRSLRLGHVEGWANYGGYDYRIVRAMARREYVLSVRFVDGKPVLFEGMPTNPGEELLTDDGEGENRDNIRDFVEGTGNDVLTMNERTAKLCGISKGTVDNDGQLMTQLGIARGAVQIKDRGAKIMDSWHKNIDAAKERFFKLYREYQQVQVENPPNYDNRTKARGLRKQKLLEMKGILERWHEALWLWTLMNGIPGPGQIETAIKQIELEQSLDRREQRR